MVNAFFKKMGLDEKEIKVMTKVISLGAQPASIIAKHVNMDRTTVYRILKNLAANKMLATTKQHGVTVFYLEKTEDLKRFLEKEKERIEKLSDEFHEIEPYISMLRADIQKLPRIQIYEGFSQLEHFYSDIVARAIEQELLQIRILGSNTFSQKLEQKELGDIVKNFEKDAQKNAIKTDILIAQGNLTREWLTNLPSLKAMSELPAAGGSTNVILVGESVFMVSFRDFPVGVRIDHPDIAYTMHFLFDIAKKQA